ncbi:MAG: hypothetical protein IH957_00140 [Chloroflexi bacterium]|nr:hypothetical protein [Chloroflexota bacterium]
MPLVRDQVIARLPKDLRDMNHRIRSVWLQLHYHSPKVHYEVWLARKNERIEIGLHFEGPKEFSYLWAERIAPYMPEIQARLGSAVELEEWTSSWTRLHQTLPYDPLNEPLAEEVAARLADTIVTLQPIVERERKNIPSELENAADPNAGKARRRFGGRHHRR